MSHRWKSRPCVYCLQPYISYGHCCIDCMDKIHSGKLVRILEPRKTKFEEDGLRILPWC